MRNNNKEKGIVLLEAVVAVGVLVTIFSAAIALYIGAVGGLRMTNDQLIANYLAQDGMEQVIAKRQHNFNKDTLNWFEGMDSCTQAAPCAIDYFTNSSLNNPLVACGADNCRLHIDANGIFSHKAGEPASYFRRTVEFDALHPYEMKATVRVYWQDGPKELRLSVSDIFYDY